MLLRRLLTAESAAAGVQLRGRMLGTGLSSSRDLTMRLFQEQFCAVILRRLLREGLPKTSHRHRTSSQS